MYWRIWNVVTAGGAIGISRRSSLLRCGSYMARKHGSISDDETILNAPYYVDKLGFFIRHTRTLWRAMCLWTGCRLAGMVLSISRTRWPSLRKRPRYSKVFSSAEVRLHILGKIANNVFIGPNTALFRLNASCHPVMRTIDRYSNRFYLRQTDVPFSRLSPSPHSIRGTPQKNIPVEMVYAPEIQEPNPVKPRRRSL